MAYTDASRRQIAQPPIHPAASTAAQAAVISSLAACDCPNHWKPGGRSCTQAPCVTQRKPSRSATIVASVTTIEGIRTHATSAPLIAAHQRAHQTAAAPASGVGSPMRANTPVATLQIANCEPTEISICR